MMSGGQGRLFIPHIPEHCKHDGISSNINAVSKGSFKSREEYYRSDEWRNLRRIKMDQSGNQCEQCHSMVRLEVHHVSYERLYREQLDDLKVLCIACHPNADRQREYRNALSTYIEKKYGEDYPDDVEEEFDRWLERQE
jgi:hypothetical protein